MIFNSPSDAQAAKNDELGDLPEWELGDLYPGPQSDAFSDDVAKAARDATAFTEKWRGKLAGTAEAGGDRLATAIQEYEALSDLLGRVGSFAMLHYVGDTTDQARGKFFGDVQQQLTDISTGLLFFELEFNKIDDAVMAEALKDAALAHYQPWIDDLRREKPYQLDDKIEELFHEKSLTSRGAFNRLFDETMASLEFDVEEGC